MHQVVGADEIARFVWVSERTLEQPIMDNHINPELAIRLGCFAGVFLMLAMLEAFAPRRRLTVSKPTRWASNLGLVVLNTVILRITLPVGAIGMADFALSQGWGVLNYFELPAWAALILAFLALDLAIYLQHVIFHAVPILWRLHMVHHADLDFDVSTGLRFHTIEILLSMGIKFAVVLFIGAPALAVLIFEVALNATSMFNHANVRLPWWLDRVVRLFVVTPDMHRVHHSVLPDETNSNFGFNLPWWDFLFGTYQAQPMAGHEEMPIGLAQFRDVWVERLHWMLALPFIGSVGMVRANAADGVSQPSLGRSSLVDNEPKESPVVTSSSS
jgi:sterol desaturase/sphingolipid hydroxylase (fatty acid hydroxylase superfamily)